MYSYSPYIINYASFISMLFIFSHHPSYSVWSLFVIRPFIRLFVVYFSSSIHYHIASFITIHSWFHRCLSLTQRLFIIFHYSFNLSFLSLFFTIIIHSSFIRHSLSFVNHLFIICSVLVCSKLIHWSFITTHCTNLYVSQKMCVWVTSTECITYER